MNEKNMPLYWENHLKEKINRIHELQAQGGKNSVSVGFISDVHWRTNLLGSVGALERVLFACSIPYYFNGGDTVSGCGLCEMYSCPQGLSPATLIGIYKSKLRKNGLKPEALPTPSDAKADRDGRLVPMHRLIGRLDIVAYDHDAPLTEEAIKASKLKLSLSQSIGAPPVPGVKKGDAVKKGDVLASAAENALSLPIHAPEDGVVADVNDKCITITLN